MSVNVVQTLTQSTSSGQVGSLQSGAFGSSVTGGNTLVVAALGTMGSNAATITISDSEGNSYTCDGFDCYNSGDDVIANPGSSNVPALTTWLGLWHAPNVTGGSSFKITCTIGGSHTSTIYFAALEVSGLGTSPTLDGSLAHNAVSGTSNPTTGSFSTADAADLILTGFVGTGANGHSVTSPWNGSWTSLVTRNPSGLNTVGNIDYLVTSSTQSGLNPTWTTGGVSQSVAIAIALTGGSPPGPPSGLTITGQTQTTVSLDWTPNSSGAATEIVVRNCIEALDWN